MSTIGELVGAPKEADFKGQGNTFAKPTQEVAKEPDDGFLNRAVHGAPGEPPLDGAVRILRSPSLSHPANSGVRAVSLKRTQQTFGNSFAQRAVAQARKKPATTAPVLQRKCSCAGACSSCQGKAVEEEPKLLQRQTAPAGAPGDPLDASVVPPSSTGQPLDKDTRTFMEGRFESDFSEVRVHTGAPAAQSADALQADAYTTGRDIYFAAGKYAPATNSGQRLLAHELTHTIQQEQAVGFPSAAAKADGNIVVGSVGDPLEKEADRVAEAIVSSNGHSSHRVTAKATTPTLQRQKAPAGRAEVTLPAGQNFGFLSNGAVVIRNSWWGQSEKNPEKLAEVLQGMRAAQYYWWMTDTQIQHIAQRFHIENYAREAVFSQCSLDPAILRVIGPPPEANFMFQRDDQGIQAVIRSRSVSELPLTNPITATLSIELQIELLEALDKYTGIPSTEAGCTKFFNVKHTVILRSEPEAGSLFSFKKEDLDTIYGPDQYKHLYLDKRGVGDAKPKLVKQVPTGGGVMFSFDSDVSGADIDYATEWLRNIGGAPTPVSGGPQVPGKTHSQVEIDLMREIDQHPQKTAILAKLRGRLRELDWFVLRWAINAAAYEASAKGFDLQAAPASELPAFSEKVEGHIVVEGLAYPGRTNRIWFEKSSPGTAFRRAEIINIQWFVEKKKGEATWEKVGGPEETREINAREPDYFEYAFPWVGIYRINAFVYHNWFVPARITEEVEVKTEEQRLSQVKTEAFSGMGDPKVTEENKDFETSPHNELESDLTGSDQFDKGKELRGNLPDDWKRLSDADRLKFITTDKNNLNALIKQYDKPGISNEEQKIVRYAQDRLESIAKQESKIAGQMRDGYVFFEARGAYLSRTKGVADASLHLLGMAQGKPGLMKLVIHDFSHLLDPSDLVFEAEGNDFRDAAEKIFVKICKHYPAGRMSVLFERVNNANLPQKNTIGFELDTNTAWKEVRSLVWDPAVTIAVNLLGAAIIIFAPYSAPIVLAVLALYNSTEVVSRMSEEQESGQLSRLEFGKGVFEIGLNVLPVIGELKAMSIAAKAGLGGMRAATAADNVVLYGLQSATVGGMLVLMTADGVKQCQKLQENDVSKVAQLLAKLDDIRKRNPNSPEIEGLEKELKNARELALGRAVETFEGMAQSLAMILVPMAAMSRIAKTMAGRNLGALIKEGKFVHQEGVTPQYDLVDGVIRGDKTKVTAEVLESLKTAYATDQAIKQAQLEQLAGTDKVEIIYIEHSTEVSVRENVTTGMITIEAPPGTPFKKVIEDARNRHFSKQIEASEKPAIGSSDLEATNKGQGSASTSVTLSSAESFTPTNDVQDLALNDWITLQESESNYKLKITWERWLAQYEKGLVFDFEITSRRWKKPEGIGKELEKFPADAKASVVVSRLTTESAGPGGSTSTFKSFYETCQRRGLIRDSAELETLIEEIGFKGRSVNVVRHKLKQHLKPKLMDQASQARWDSAKIAEMQNKHPELPWNTEPVKAMDAAGHREMSDVIKDLDSSDKGPMFEQWEQENAFPTAEKQVAATRHEIDNQLKPGEVLASDRKIDLLDTETVIEAKTGDGKLSSNDASLDANRKPTSQLLDYLRMARSEVTITVNGCIVKLKRVKYVFQTTRGAKTNLDTIIEVFLDPANVGKITFDVFDPNGMRYTIKSRNDLAKPDLAWLSEK